MAKVKFKKLAEAINAAATVGASLALAFSARDNRYGLQTLSANLTLTLSGQSLADQMVVTFAQPASGGTYSYTVTWPAAIKWAGGSAPTMPTGASKQMMVTLYHDGTMLLGTARTDF